MPDHDCQFFASGTSLVSLSVEWPNFKLTHSSPQILKSRQQRNKWAVDIIETQNPLMVISFGEEAKVTAHMKEAEQLGNSFKKLEK